MKMIVLGIAALSIGIVTADEGQPRKRIAKNESALTTQVTKKPEQNQQSPESKAIESLIGEMKLQEQERAAERHAQENQTRQDRDIQGKLVKYTWALVWVGGLQWFVLLATAGVIYLQTRIMRRQSGLIIERERPRIFVKFEKYPEIDRGDKMSLIRYEIECLCPTPAFFEVGEIEACVEDGIPSVPSSFPVVLPSVIKKSQPFDVWTPIFQGDTMAHLDIQKLNREEITLYCRGFIKYRGVHLLPKEPSYRTPFYKKWTPQPTDIPGLENGGCWEDYPDAEANRNT